MPYASDKKLSKTPKEGWLEIPEQVYKELLFIVKGMNPLYKGFYVEGDSIVKVERGQKEKPEIALDFAEKIKQQIDNAAGGARLRYITEAPGQTGVYLEKMYQASRYIENLPTNMDGFEYVVGEAEARGITYLEAAELIVSVANLWNKQISPEIEKLRIQAKNDIDQLPEGSPEDTIIAIGEAAIAALRAI